MKVNEMVDLFTQLRHLRKLIDVSMEDTRKYLNTLE